MKIIVNTIDGKSHVIGEFELGEKIKKEDVKDVLEHFEQFILNAENQNNTIITIDGTNSNDSFIFVIKHIVSIAAVED